jgi:hypothetical protein
MQPYPQSQSVKSRFFREPVILQTDVGFEAKFVADGVFRKELSRLMLPNIIGIS